MRTHASSLLGLATAVTTLALAGCGSAESDAVRDVVSEFVQEIVEGDAAGACALVDGEVPCERLTASVLAPDDPDALEVEVEIRGDRATALPRFRGSPAAAVELPGVAGSLELVKVAGEWRISDRSFDALLPESGCFLECS